MTPVYWEDIFKLLGVLVAAFIIALVIAPPITRYLINKFLA